MKPTPPPSRLIKEWSCEKISNSKNSFIECLYILIGILLYCSLLGWMDARDQRLEKNKLAIENRKLKQSTQACIAELNNGLNPAEVHAYNATCYLQGYKMIAKKS